MPQFSLPVFIASTMTLATRSFAGLATTTHYSDGLQGACGCGNDLGTWDWSYGISKHVYTAAASQAIFDSGATDATHWCGSGCGKCFRLTSTGVSTCDTCGEGGEEGKSITVMVTNLCPFRGNEQWCPNPDELNPHGYGYHFDIMGGRGVFGDNVVVEFEEVKCPGDAGFRWKTCECHPGLRDKDLSLTGSKHAIGAGVVGPDEARIISINGSPELPAATVAPVPVHAPEDSAPQPPAATIAEVAPVPVHKPTEAELTVGPLEGASLLQKVVAESLGAKTVHPAAAGSASV
ncbi:RlpA-like double-psi beta-barrel-protein domain-containing protein-containing protein [Aspergillus multicolor]|uniref:putative endoglucanase n=1 Tax=Aspergillus multicolor TaxID=41759 RepID=UPI003CCD1848